MKLIAPVLTVLALFGGACLNEELLISRIDLQGTVVSSEEGPVFMEFHHAQQGEGELAHPLGWIEGISLDAPGDFQHLLDYPDHLGTGLFVYAWQDLDGDGLLCSPGAAAEPSGAATVIDSPGLAVTVEIELNTSCLGPERLFFQDISNEADEELQKGEP